MFRFLTFFILFLILFTLSGIKNEIKSIREELFKIEIVTYSEETIPSQTIDPNDVPTIVKSKENL